MSALVRIVDGEPRADSREIARDFGKHHPHVMRSIDRLLRELPPERASIFGRTFDMAPAPNGAKRSVRYFLRLDDDFEQATWPDVVDQTRIARACWGDCFDDAEEDDAGGGDICDEPHDARDEDGI